MADNNGLKLLKILLQKLKAFFFSKDILSFLLFLALSSGFWFVHALGKEKETIVTVPIRYVGIPQNILITNSPPTEISIAVKDQGMRLLDYSRHRINPLSIELNQTYYQKGEILVTTDQIVGKISRLLKPSTTIVEVSPDTLLIRYERLESKVLPVEFVSKIELAHQYLLSDKIQLDPLQVTVFGPKNVLENLNSVKTEQVVLNALNDTTTFVCKLKPIKSVRFSSKDIKVSIYVEQFTEKKIIKPITFVNCPANFSIRTFPAVVNVIYTVGLSRFNSLNTNDMQVYLDYNDLISGKLGNHKLKVKINTNQITNVRVIPEEVEFILEEK